MSLVLCPKIVALLRSFEDLVQFLESKISESYNWQINLSPYLLHEQILRLQLFKKITVYLIEIA